MTSIATATETSKDRCCGEVKARFAIVSVKELPI
jgi:hypothetical protein